MSRYQRKQENQIVFHTNLSNGSYNPIVTTNDQAILFNSSNNSTNGFVIAPWNTNSFGLRFDTYNTCICINKSSSSGEGLYALDVNGGIKCNGLTAQSLYTNQINGLNKTNTINFTPINGKISGTNIFTTFSTPSYCKTNINLQFPLNIQATYPSTKRKVSLYFDSISVLFKKNHYSKLLIAQLIILNLSKMVVYWLMVQQAL